MIRRQIWPAKVLFVLLTSWGTKCRTGKQSQKKNLSPDSTQAFQVLAPPLSLPLQLTTSQLLPPRLHLSIATSPSPPPCWPPPCLSLGCLNPCLPSLLPSSHLPLPLPLPVFPSPLSTSLFPSHPPILHAHLAFRFLIIIIDLFSKFECFVPGVLSHYLTIGPT